MSRADPPEFAPRRTLWRPRFRVWHLCLLTAFVAFAIVNIQDQGRREPFLIAAAAGGFALYAVLGWAGWRIALRSRLERVPRLAAYLASMAALFVVACFSYIAIERWYLG